MSACPPRYGRLETHPLLRRSVVAPLTTGSRFQVLRWNGTSPPPYQTQPPTNATTLPLSLSHHTDSANHETTATKNRPAFPHSNRNGNKRKHQTGSRHEARLTGNTVTACKVYASLCKLLIIQAERSIRQMNRTLYQYEGTQSSFI